MIAKFPGHPFAALPILSEPDLIEALQANVTLEPTDEVPMSTGVPPHVAHSISIEKVGVLTKELGDKMSTYQEKLQETVEAAIDKKIVSEGGINHAIMSEAMEKLKMDLLNELKTHLSICPCDKSAPIDVPLVSNEVSSRGFLFYRGGWWCVPETFSFPRGISRKLGWWMWLKGALHPMADSNIQHKVKPYRFLGALDFVSKKNKSDFKNGWQPIFSMMMVAPGVDIPKKEEDITDECVDSTYTIATAFLKERYSYIFKKSTDGTLSGMSLFTWSRKVRHSEVKKHGTPSDKAFLPASKPMNTADGEFRTRKRAHKEVTKGPRKGMSRRQEAARNNNNSDNDDSSVVVGEDFADAFPGAGDNAHAGDY